MKTKLARYLFPAVAAISILLLAGVSACTSQEPESASELAPSNHPDAASGSRAETMPAAPDQDLVLEFAAAQNSINSDWDQFHVDFDGWRASLVACDRTAALAALRKFASDFAEITEQARDLPGKGIARELPDNVILAATGEDASLRMLRDNWQPGNPALLENAQTERSNAATLLRSTAIEVDKLEELDKPEDQEIAKDFANALEPVDEAWDAFYDSYEVLADAHIDLSAAEIVTRLKTLADEHAAVLESLEDIPSDKVTDPVQDALIDAAESERKALGNLLDAMRKAAKAETGDDTRSGGSTAAGNGNGANGEKVESENSGSDGAAGDVGTPQGSAEGNAPGSPGSGQLPGHLDPGVQGGIPVFPGLADPPFPTATPSPSGQEAGPAGPPPSPSTDGDYSGQFDTFEETLEGTRASRKQAGRDLEVIIEGVSEEDQKALAEFTRAFDDLMENWDAFHAEFDEWVRTEGDCNRSSAVADLNDFNHRFSQLDNRVRALSQASYLRPSSDLLSEAAQREGAALRSLTGTWAPYENDVYRGLDEERANAASLRRLADRRTQELMERYGIQQ